MREIKTVSELKAAVSEYEIVCLDIEDAARYVDEINAFYKKTKDKSCGSLIRGMVGHSEVVRSIPVEELLRKENLDMEDIFKLFNYLRSADQMDVSRLSELKKKAAEIKDPNYKPQVQTSVINQDEIDSLLNSVEKD